MNKSISRFLSTLALAAASCAMAAPNAPATKAAAPAKVAAGADQGVTAETIRIGRTGSMSGINARQGNAANAGIKAYFDEINAKGGVYGRTLELVTIDDQYKASIAADAAEKLLDPEEQIFALILSNGTGPSNAVLPLAHEAKVPMIGSTSGSVNRDPAKYSRYFFNVRNSNYQDARGITGFLSNQDPEIAVIYQDDAFGKAALADFVKAAEDDKVKIVGKYPFSTTVSGGTSMAVERLVQEQGAGVHNIAMLALDKPAGALVTAIREKWLTARIFTTTSAGELEREADPKDMEGVIVSQSFPAVTSFDTPALVKFREVMSRRGPGYVKSVVAFEGYMAAAVLVQGLKDAGKNLSREGLVDALEKFHMRDMDGLFYTYDTPSHWGMGHNELFMFGPKGSIIY